MLHLFIPICYIHIIYRNKKELGDCSIPYTSCYVQLPSQAHHICSFITSSWKKIPLHMGIPHPRIAPPLQVALLDLSPRRGICCLWHEFLLSHFVPALLIISLRITTNWILCFLGGAENHQELSKCTIILVSELCLKRNGNASRAVFFRPFCCILSPAFICSCLSSLHKGPRPLFLFCSWQKVTPSQQG